jgi:hypothetical protein
MRLRFIARLFFALILGTILMLPSISVAMEKAQEWEIINPAGVIEIKQVQLAPRITTLEGKTIVLRWNGKHNGNLAESARIAQVIKGMGADIVIAAQTD